MSLDKSIILSAVDRIVKADGTQQRIIADMLVQMLDVPHVTRIAICTEAVKSFPSTAKKAGGKGYSQYQYASRMKAIVGAAFLVDGFKPVGSVNAIYTAATAALKGAGLDAEGNKVAAVQAAKEQDKRAKATAEQTAKLVANNPKLTGEEIAKLAAVAVDRQMADAMLAKLQESAEAAAKRMVEGQGFDYAMEYAKALLTAVKGMSNVTPIKQAA